MPENKPSYGQIAYEAYCAYLDTQNLPPWNHLSLVQCAAWEKAAEAAVIRYVKKEVPPTTSAQHWGNWGNT